MTRRRLLILVLALAAALPLAGCTGTFNLTRQVHHWNAECSEDPWVREAAFVGLLPAYAFCFLGDAIVFNSIAFFSGHNPIAPPDSEPIPRPAEEEGSAR